jgi:hypothetical protein
MIILSIAAMAFVVKTPRMIGDEFDSEKAEKNRRSKST